MQGIKQNKLSINSKSFFEGNMAVPLDLAGNISLVLQVIILFLLLLGLPLAKGFGGKKNLLLHGYLTVTALILHTFPIFIVMIPAFGSELGELGELSFLNTFTVWSHVILGTVAEILGFIIVVYWVPNHHQRWLAQE
jgi:ABC-type dipeptide/oligopeptide/nickel transport system permease component